VTSSDQDDVKRELADHTGIMRSLGGLAVLLVVAVIGCSEPLTDPTGRTWELVTLHGSEPIEATTIDLTLEDDSMSGSAGCNNYNGAAEFEDGSMTLGPDIATTRMACEQEIMDQESAYLSALARVSAYVLEPDELLLQDADGITLMTFR
jgi:heat shock protein HslJ